MSIFAKMKPDTGMRGLFCVFAGVWSGSGHDLAFRTLWGSVGRWCGRAGDL